MDILNRIITHLKSASKFAEENKKILIKLSGIAAGIIICSVLMLTLFTSAYEVYIDGEKVAVVSDKADFKKGLDKANEAIVQIAGKGYKITEIPRYVVTVAARAWLTDENDIKNNIMSHSNAISEVCYINIDGQDIAPVKTQDGAEKLIQLAVATYKGENKQILNKIEYKNKYEAAINICSEDVAIKKVLNALKVKTEKTDVYNAEIVCSRIENPTEEMFINEEKIVSEGENGAMEVTAKVTEINGVAAEATTISRRVIREPVNEVVMVGRAQIPSIGTGLFENPFYGTITSRFGARWGRRHTGTDIAGKVGSPIKAADNGVVITAEFQDNGYGNIVIIDHQNGIHTWYAHLDKIGANVGDVVEKGSVIGELGNTGNSTGPHLHFEVRENGTPVNPSKYIDALK